jgi:hypothetical protein
MIVLDDKYVRNLAMLYDGYQYTPIPGAGCLVQLCCGTHAK